MGRKITGTERRQTTGFSIEATTLTKAKKKAGNIPLSRIVDQLLKGWADGEITLPVYSE